MRNQAFQVNRGKVRKVSSFVASVKIPASMPRRLHCANHFFGGTTRRACDSARAALITHSFFAVVISVRDLFSFGSTSSFSLTMSTPSRLPQAPLAFPRSPASDSSAFFLERHQHGTGLVIATVVFAFETDRFSKVLGVLSLVHHRKEPETVRRSTLLGSRFGCTTVMKFDTERMVNTAGVWFWLRQFV